MYICTGLTAGSRYPRKDRLHVNDFSAHGKHINKSLAAKLAIQLQTDRLNINDKEPSVKTSKE